jgi:hypothetical protein
MPSTVRAIGVRSRFGDAQATYHARVRRGEDPEASLPLVVM